MRSVRKEKDSEKQETEVKGKQETDVKKKRGRPPKHVTEEQKVTKSTQLQLEKKDKTFKLGNEIIRPYRGKETLPKAVFDSKGNVIKPGEPRHFVTRQGDDYKLIRVYRAKGIKHALVRMIKPKKRNKPEEKEILSQLKRLEIPGTY